MSADSWMFSDPPNVAVFTTRRVIVEGEPIVYVSHDADDGAWQFHCAGKPVLEDGILVSLRKMVDRDPTLLELADLPLGWRAERPRPGSAWTRYNAAVARSEADE
jgi:hypothetical protein